MRRRWIAARAPLAALVALVGCAGGGGFSLVRGGADVLVNVSNDFWLGGPGGSEQHLAAAVFRAVELARPLLRATNTGVTAAIDARGRILARLAPDRPSAATVEVRPGGGLTPYARMGDAFAWLAAAAALLAAGAGAVRARLRRPRAGR
jgi:apolipoprotein N-acyltransferase